MKFDCFNCLLLNFPGGLKRNKEKKVELKKISIKSGVLYRTKS